MKPTLTAVLLALAFTCAALVASNCGGINCSPCPRGMHASDPTRKCSACVPDVDGGAGDAADSGDDAPADAPPDASLDTSRDTLPDTSLDTSLDILPDTSLDTNPEASVDTSPETSPTCSLFPDVGCFSGAACSSSRVDAVCVDGTWRCPAGSSSAEHCPPDSGADAPGADAPDAGIDAPDALEVGDDAPDAGVDAQAD